ncbi:MAG: hypothetical protein V9H26_29210 [Verrucomicrobiota bacterium]
MSAQNQGLNAFQPCEKYGGDVYQDKILRSGLILLLIMSVLSLPLYTGAATDDKVETITASLKRTIQSPPAIEEFEVSCRDLRSRIPAKLMPTNAVDITPAVQVFTGSRSGANFFLEQKNIPKNIVGRMETNSYNIVPNAVYFGFVGTDSTNQYAGNRISQSSEGSFRLVTQFCQMGLGDIAPGSITWDGDSFVGLDTSGRTQYGSLEISNNVPFKLAVRWKKGEPPFKTIDFVYPEDGGEFGGFPKKVVISTLFEDGLNPFLEIVYEKVRLAPGQLPKDFFNPTKFISAEVVYTNIWSRSNLTSISPNGSVTVAIDSLQTDFQSLKACKAN